MLEKMLAAAKALGFETAAALNVKTLKNKPEVRAMCAEDKCQAYNRNWGCPPACGTLEQCQSRMEQYTHGILVQTVGELEDSWDYEGIQELGQRHRDRFLAMADSLREQGIEALVLGAGGCTRCSKCAYPEPCRMPDRIMSSMEGYGLLVNEVCQSNGVAYYYGTNTLAYTGCILFGKKEPVLDEIARHAINGRIGDLLRCIRKALSDGIVAEEIAAAMTRHFLNDETARTIEEYDLTRLLQAARATSRGMELLRPHLLGSSGLYRYSAVIGTASGDLHDLGKNMVAMMLEAVGYRVIDLGIDVSPDDFVRAVDSDESVRLVGVSCLLSTSIDSVKKTVKKLQRHPNRKRFKIAVGGGATNADIARMCGADVYTHSAIDAGEYAKDLLRSQE